MASSDILYIKGMNRNDSDDEMDEEVDIWDDRKLNDAYDKALKMANLEVAKRVAMATNSVKPNKDKPEETSQPQSNQQKSNKQRKKSKQSKAFKQTQKQDSEHSWKEGMPCRAMYSADGFDYEANILSILDNENCVIRYLGYNNTEIVPISSLQLTLGKQARKDQMVEALTALEEDELSTHSTTMDNDFSDGFERTQSSSNHRPARNKKLESGRGFQLPNIPMPDLSMLRDFGQMDLPTPPPPLVGMQGMQPSSDDQALSNMLVSWYMSGYYTGLYHGMKRLKQRHRDC